MRGSGGRSTWAVQPLLECEREIPSYPPAVRARAVARARALLAAGGPQLAAPPTPVWRTRWSVAAVIACCVSAASGAAAYEVRAQLVARAQILAVASSVEDPAPSPSRPYGARRVNRVIPAERTMLATAEAPPIAADTAQAELHLLRRARTAVASGNHAAALHSIGRHTRRFAHGRLVEEREALRIRALAGLGRTDEARAASRDFAALFPHSVLLPIVGRIPTDAR